jgi:hypothetical protein
MAKSLSKGCFPCLTGRWGHPFCCQIAPDFSGGGLKISLFFEWDSGFLERRGLTPIVPLSAIAKRGKIVERSVEQKEAVSKPLFDKETSQCQPWESALSERGLSDDSPDDHCRDRVRLVGGVSPLCYAKRGKTLYKSLFGRNR